MRESGKNDQISVGNFAKIKLINTYLYAPPPSTAFLLSREITAPSPKASSPEAASRPDRSIKNYKLK